MNYKFHETTRPRDPYSGSQRFILTHIACFSSVPPGKCRDGNLNFVTTNSFYILLNSQFTTHRVTRRYTKEISLSTSRRYIEGAEAWIHSFLTSATDESGNSTPRALYSRERSLVPNEQEAGWVREPVWTIAWSIKYLMPLPAFGPRTVQPAA